jgi:hypothetical protein
MKLRFFTSFRLAVCILLVGAGFESVGVAQQGCMEWDARVLPFDAASSELYAATYDSIRGVTLILATSKDAAGDWAMETWLWDGATFELAATGGPSLRTGYSLAFDDDRGVVVLYGGYDSILGNIGDPGYDLGDTWEWDGLQWEDRLVSGPGSRGLQAMVYDAGSGMITMFGGSQHTLPIVLGDTWGWDGVVWTQLASDGPEARVTTMAYDPLRGVIVLVGGADGGRFADVWEWNGATWAFKAWIPFDARARHAMTYDPVRRRTLLYGGQAQSFESPFPADMWEWDGLSWALLDSDAPPGGRAGAWLVYDVERNTAVMIGGTVSSDPEDAWEWKNVYSFPDGSPAAEVYPACTGVDYAPKNRIISVIPPTVPSGAGGSALRVTVASAPGVGQCSGMPDFSSFVGTEMWVGDEVHGSGGSPSGYFALQSEPLFRDWTTVPGGVVQISDCNVIPCSSYTIESVSDIDYPGGPFSAPVTLQTASIWGDVMGTGGFAMPDGLRGILDVVSIVDCVKQDDGAVPSTWCDLFGALPEGGADGVLNVFDITTSVDALKALAYPWTGPTAPAPCAGQ